MKSLYFLDKTLDKPLRTRLRSQKSIYVCVDIKRRVTAGSLRILGREGDSERSSQARVVYVCNKTTFISIGCWQFLL